MHLQAMKNQISRSNPQKRNSADGSSKSQRHGRLATPTECHGHTFIFGIYRVLPLLHTKLLAHHPAYDPTHMEEHPIQLGSILHLSI